MIIYTIYKELSDLKAEVAKNTAIRPYQDALIQCGIDKAFLAAINYTKEKTCKMIEGVLCLPSEPTVTGLIGANGCCYPRLATTAGGGTDAGTGASA